MIEGMPHSSKGGIETVLMMLKIQCEGTIASALL
jgi:hypothetical protein